MVKGNKMAMGVPYNTKGNTAPSVIRPPYNAKGNSASSMLSDPRSGRFDPFSKSSPTPTKAPTTTINPQMSGAQASNNAAFISANSGNKMAKGGTASSRADGCAVKGKTKGRFV